MALIARVKWATGFYPTGSDAKYLASLSFSENESAAEGADKYDDRKYTCKIQAFFVGRSHQTPEDIYVGKFSTLPQAMSFFSDLINATGAIHCDTTRENDFTTKPRTTDERMNLLTGNIKEGLDALADQIMSAQPANVTGALIAISKGLKDMGKAIDTNPEPEEK